MVEELIASSAKKRLEWEQTLEQRLSCLSESKSALSSGVLSFSSDHAKESITLADWVSKHVKRITDVLYRSPIAL